MDWSQRLQLLLFSLLCLTGNSKAVGELCEDKGRETEWVFSVSGDAAMLTSTLLDLNVSDNRSIPYNISWYYLRTGTELTRETGKTLVRGKTLWIFNITMEDAGDYECVVRLPSECYKKVALLIVNHTNPEKCDRPEKAQQVLTNTATSFLNCPLSEHIREVDNYSIQWYKGCEPIVEDDPLWNRFSYVSHSAVELLRVEVVTLEDHAFYTCTMTFNLEGFSGRISETINSMVDVEYCLEPKVVEPANEIIKADLGSSFSKMCRVFVPSVGNKHCANLNWIARDNSISKIVSERVFQESQRGNFSEEKEGVWLERNLNFLTVEEEDFSIHYTCKVSSDRGSPSASFTLQPTDPNNLFPIGVLLTSLVLVFTVSVVIYHRFKIDIVLSLRRVFPLLYPNTDSDGKLYDAYVAYPRLFGDGGRACGEAEMFALHTLPQVLEGRCGYRLFILGRDSLPGEAVLDAVEESMLASRCLLLVYSGSTFCSDSSGVLEAWQSFERQTAMHHALLEGSLKVVLVELEEVTPTQLALFPESVRHLRERQGAVCWWKSSRTRRTKGLRCGRWRKEVAEKRGEQASPPLSSPSLFLSSRFWKELRYYMPVRGMRTMCPEKNSLLNL
ncbi:interleukin-1 receptor type 1-like [Oncorhynchus nerka]|uniref:interleukin-1 receptor type 1-like n=1 Tax=Oncorhynchus nerka TaxID=8023 RepID=UPI0011327234|nr:interleukin-1 receptor type 1-like isoform X1 [Oncorhynchus nerka]XP_029515740.1 interleukin-1 receptor type 1-like isoform X2 [Oncorhynchus nerka]